jgi:hypothetical protein
MNGDVIDRSIGLTHLSGLVMLVCNGYLISYLDPVFVIPDEYLGYDLPALIGNNRTYRVYHLSPVQHKEFNIINTDFYYCLETRMFILLEILWFINSL